MLSILDRYNWRQFGIVTSEIAGHDDFVQAVRDGVNAKEINGRRWVLIIFLRFLEINRLDQVNLFRAWQVTN